MISKLVRRPLWQAKSVHWLTVPTTHNSFCVFLLLNAKQFETPQNPRAHFWAKELCITHFIWSFSMAPTFQDFAGSSLVAALRKQTSFFFQNEILKSNFFSREQTFWIWLKRPRGFFRGNPPIWNEEIKRFGWKTISIITSQRRGNWLLTGFVSLARKAHHVGQSSEFFLFEQQH